MQQSISAAHARGDHSGDGRSDFDFLIGRWSIRNRRLQKRLKADTIWDEFAGATEMRPILGGLGNIDDNINELPTGAYRAVSIRAFNPETLMWSIWWLDSRNSAIEPPVQGSFRDGVGTFLGKDVFEGRPILVRFIWSRITAQSARWEQAFSDDEGASWETNWIMDFERSE
jgi:hypothetical protein